MSFLQPIQVEKRGPTPDVMAKQHNAISKQSWDGLGYVWGEEFRPKHFTEAGASEYGYRPRTAEYEKKKQRMFGHKNPLEYTGETKRKTEHYRVSATADGATVTMRAGHLNFTRRANELRTISSGEARSLAKSWSETYEHGLSDLKAGSNENVKG